MTPTRRPLTRGRRQYVIQYVIVQIRVSSLASKPKDTLIRVSNAKRSIANTKLRSTTRGSLIRQRHPL